MPRRYVIQPHAARRMMERSISMAEVRMTFRRPDFTGTGKDGRELRSKELGGRLVTLSIEPGTRPAEIVTVWSDDA